MALHRNYKKILMVVLSFFEINIFNINSTPLNNIADSNPIYNPMGTDKYYKKLPKAMHLSLDMSPYYQSAKGSRDTDGSKVALNDIYGRWNMLSMFFDAPKMTPLNFSQANYPNLWATNIILKNIDGVDYTDPANYQQDQFGQTTANYDNTSFYQVKGEYEKLGLRGKLSFDTKIGLGVSLKGGVADYKIRPNFIEVAPVSPSVVPNPNIPTTDPAKTFYNSLLQESTRNNIFKDLGLDVNESRKTEMEDTHAQIYWCIPFYIKEEGETTATVAPHFAVGGWLSSGNKKDSTKAFDVSTGNNGHSGVTAEASLNIDFPGTVQISLGGGVLVQEDETFNTYRFPTNIYQSGFFPWTTTVTVDPGTTWYFNISFKSENFMVAVMPGFSFFFDFIYTYHEHDDYTIQDSSTQRSNLFNSAMETMQNFSSWKNQQMNFGVTYDVAKHVSLGFTIQVPISGIKVYRTVTSMGTVSINF